MKVDIDVEEAIESAAEDIIGRRYSRFSNEKIADFAYKIIDAGAIGYDDVTKIICLLLDKYPDSKSEVSDYLSEKQE